MLGVPGLDPAAVGDQTSGPSFCQAPRNDVDVRPTWPEVRRRLGTRLVAGVLAASLPITVVLAVVRTQKASTSLTAAAGRSGETAQFITDVSAWCATPSTTASKAPRSGPPPGSRPRPPSVSTPRSWVHDAGPHGTGGPPSRTSSTGPSGIWPEPRASRSAGRYGATTRSSTATCSSIWPKRRRRRAGHLPGPSA